MNLPLYSVVASTSTVVVEPSCMDGLDDLIPLILSLAAVIIVIVLFSTGLLIEPPPSMLELNLGVKDDEMEEVGIEGFRAGVNLED